MIFIIMRLSVITLKPLVLPASPSEGDVAHRHHLSRGCAQLAVPNDLACGCFTLDCLSVAAEVFQKTGLWEMILP